jgi:hypothetical protein
MKKNGFTGPVVDLFPLANYQSGEERLSFYDIIG